MKKIEVLQSLNFGNAIAEYDKNIAYYYVNTNFVYDFVEGRYDIVNGVKGSGKTAMLVAVCENQVSYKQLENKILIKAIQLKGDPDFKRAFDTVDIDNNDLQKIIDAWKIYVINIMWKQIKESLDNYGELEKYLNKEKIIIDSSGFLAKLLYSLTRVKLRVSNTLKSDGTSVQAFELCSSDDKTGEKEKKILNDMIDFNYIFSEIDKILSINNMCIWIMLDRLDDAFPDNSERNNLILKALLYSYKDLCTYEGFKIKIFIREDIFTNITKKNGFTSLTHVSAKTMGSIKWNKDIIEQLIIERLIFNKLFAIYLCECDIENDVNKLGEAERKKILFKLMKPQIDVGIKNPDAVQWIINHVTDGNGVYTPRDIIQLLAQARIIQLDILKEKSKEDIEEDYLISSTAIREAYKRISKDKLNTQLFAEYPQYRPWIEKFKNEKAEQNEISLLRILGKQWKYRVEKLKEIGFIEEKKNTWKIPFIYREELNIVQGKAK